VEVQENEPGNKVSMDQLFKGKKGVLFAVPGAFTPGCSKVTSFQIILLMNLPGCAFLFIIF
jgi:peroxiredoxin